jgi:hypothetical protein
MPQRKTWIPCHVFRGRCTDYMNTTISKSARTKTQLSSSPLRSTMFIGPPLQALRLGRREKVCATKFQYSDGDCECSNLSAPASGPSRNGDAWIGGTACGYSASSYCGSARNFTVGNCGWPYRQACCSQYGRVRLSVLSLVAAGKQKSKDGPQHPSKRVAHVRYWPKADIPRCTAHVRFWG